MITETTQIGLQGVIDVMVPFQLAWMVKSRRKIDLYKAARWVCRPFRYKVIGMEQVARGEPALFICNHLASKGPLQMIISLDIRFYPWVIAEMSDPRRAPAYLYDDFIRPAWHLNGKFGRWVAEVVGQLAVKLINGIGSIPVDKNNGWTAEAFRRSLALLHENQSILIFPEDPQGEEDPDYLMKPFQRGFVGLCRMYRDIYNKPLAVYPVAVHAATRTIQIGKAEYYTEEDHRQQAIDRFCDQLETEIQGLYRVLQWGDIPVQEIR